ncbi:MAG: hypothetical protein ABI791_06915 [Acidobacteriota bacterium]
MNGSRIVFLVIVLLAFPVAVESQETSKLILIDEFGSYPCDGFRGRIDGFLSELRDNPGSHGLVINRGRGSDEISAVMREEMIRNHIAFRGFDESRISYSRTTDGEFRTQFFRVSSAQSEPTERSKNYVATSVVSPVVVKEYNFDDLCPPLNYLNVFAKLLEQNQNARATIVVRGRTLSDARQKQKDVSTYLIIQRKIDPIRIKFFLTEKPNIDYGLDPIAEYRYVP